MLPLQPRAFSTVHDRAHPAEAYFDLPPTYADFRNPRPIDPELSARIDAFAGSMHGEDAKEFAKVMLDLYMSVSPSPRRVLAAFAQASRSLPATAARRAAVASHRFAAVVERAAEQDLTSNVLEVLDAPPPLRNQLASVSVLTEAVGLGVGAYRLHEHFVRGEHDAPAVAQESLGMAGTLTNLVSDTVTLNQSLGSLQGAVDALGDSYATSGHAAILDRFAQARQQVDTTDSIGKTVANSCLVLRNGVGLYRGVHGVADGIAKRSYIRGSKRPGILTPAFERDLIDREGRKIGRGMARIAKHAAQMVPAVMGATAGAQGIANSGAVAQAIASNAPAKVVEGLTAGARSLARSASATYLATLGPVVFQESLKARNSSSRKAYVLEPPEVLEGDIYRDWAANDFEDLMARHTQISDLLQDLPRVVEQSGHDDARKLRALGHLLEYAKHDLIPETYLQATRHHNSIERLVGDRLMGRAGEHGAHEVDLEAARPRDESAFGDLSVRGRTHFDRRTSSVEEFDERIGPDVVSGPRPRP